MTCARRLQALSPATLPACGCRTLPERNPHGEEEKTRRYVHLFRTCGQAACEAERRSRPLSRRSRREDQQSRLRDGRQGLQAVGSVQSSDQLERGACNLQGVKGSASRARSDSLIFFPHFEDYILAFYGSKRRFESVAPVTAFESTTHLTFSPVTPRRCDNPLRWPGFFFAY